MLTKWKGVDGLVPGNFVVTVLVPSIEDPAKIGNCSSMVPGIPPLNASSENPIATNNTH